MQYARPLAHVEVAVDRLRVTLIIFVLTASGMKLLAGLMVTRRASALGWQRGPQREWGSR